MKITAARGKASGISADLLALGVPEGKAVLKGEAAELDRATGGAISAVLATGTDFSGKLKDRFTIVPASGVRAKRLVLVGLGAARGINADVLRKMAGVAVREAVKVKASTVAIYAPSAAKAKMPAQEIAQAMAEGAGLGGYLFEEYRSENRKARPKSVQIVSENAGMARTMKPGAAAGEIISEAVALARDLANHPANVATPTMLARSAQRLAKTYGFKTDVLGPQQIEKLGMGGLKAVASGSSQPARFIVMSHTPARSGKPVVLVGKGLTFDSGGISIKPAENMDRMKVDMAGGAAVIAAVTAAARLKVRTNVIGLIPSTENLSGASAFRPGDVLKMYDGKTIEIISTDAEGRLILADAISYARGLKPAAIVDIATLTGACMIALGVHATGLLGTDDALMRRIEKASKTTSEKVWRLPLWDEYSEQIKSDIADMKNSGGRPGGAITAAMLLSRFAEDTPWAHLDIAGTGWSDRETELVSKGGSGVGVRLMVELVRNWAGRA
jgi:leucyl aminopeptidase